MAHAPSATTKTKAAPRRRFLRSLLILFVLTLSITTLVLLALGATGSGEKQLSFGSTKVSWQLDSDTSLDKFYVYESEDQDRDDGGFYNEKELSLRTPFGTLEITAVYDPIDSIRKRLPTTVPELTALIDSRNRFEVYCASEALASLGSNAVSSLPSIIEAAERHGSVLAAIKPIFEANPPAALPPVIGGLASTNLEVALSCAYLIQQSPTNAHTAAPALLAAFKANSTSTYRLHFVAVHFEITRNPTPWLPEVVESLNTAQDFYEIISILNLLNRIGPPAASAVPVITNILQARPSSREAPAALRALSKITSDSSILLPHTLRFLDSPDPVSRDARSAAISILSQCGPPGVARLLPLYQSTNRYDKFAAGKAFANAGPLAVVATNELQSELLSNDKERVQLACLIVASLGTNAAPLLPSLHQLLYVPKPQIRADAAAALLRLGEYNDTMIRVLVDFLANVPYGIPRREVETLFATIQTNSTAKTIYDERLALNRRAAANLKRILNEAQMFNLNLGHTNISGSQPNL